VPAFSMVPFTGYYCNSAAAILKYKPQKLNLRLPTTVQHFMTAESNKNQQACYDASLQGAYWC
ncbi:MAG: hypothetical protein Q4F21_15210, partial [Lachnospiraceae bacterium]|nr:hypothetical protein [Lachnospiraceae bacterium]